MKCENCEGRDIGQLISDCVENGKKQGALKELNIVKLELFGLQKIALKETEESNIYFAINSEIRIIYRRIKELDRGKTHG